MQRISFLKLSLAASSALILPLKTPAAKRKKKRFFISAGKDRSGEGEFLIRVGPAMEHLKL